jgi:thioesterase domain-containing protein/acyl carrier protein
MIPSLYVPLDALPLDANGKLDRRALPAPALPARPTAGTRKPGSPLEERIARLFEDVLGLQQVGVGESFFDLGGDSLAAAEICAQLGSETGLELPVATLLRAPTVEELALLVGSTDGLAEHSSLVPIQPRGSQPPLFLVNDLEGRVLGYAELARLLGRDQPVWGLQSMAGADRIPSVAARYLEDVLRVQPSGPYRLGGWCFGGVVAFEMAHQLLERGDEIELLALIGISAYDFPRLVSSTAWRRYQRSRTFPLLRDHLTRARAMSVRDGSRYLLHQSMKVGPYLSRRRSSRVAGPTSRLPGGSSVAEGALRANRDAFARYVPQALPGRVTLILSREETATYSSDPSSDWRGLATGGVDVHEVPGGHDEMLTEPRVQELARLLADALAPVRPID